MKELYNSKYLLRILCRCFYDSLFPCLSHSLSLSTSLFFFLSPSSLFYGQFVLVFSFGQIKVTENNSGLKPSLLVQSVDLLDRSGVTSTHGRLEQRSPSILKLLDNRDSCGHSKTKRNIIYSLYNNYSLV